MLIIIDGPEKAGKSTLIEGLKAKARACQSRHWGLMYPDDRGYKSKFIHDTTVMYPVFWDRGWPSEHVYGNLLERNRRLSHDPMLGEWLWGRGCVAKYIVLPDDPAELVARRTSEDLAVSPWDEFFAYQEYADRFGYTILRNRYNESSLNHNIDHVLADLSRVDTKRVIPQIYCGRQDAGVVFVTEERDYDIPGGTLPFSTAEDYRIFKEVFGRTLLNFGWANKTFCPPQLLKDKIVIESK